MERPDEVSVAEHNLAEKLDIQASLLPEGFEQTAELLKQQVDFFRSRGEGTERSSLEIKLAWVEAVHRQVMTLLLLGRDSRSSEVQELLVLMRVLMNDLATRC